MKLSRLEAISLSGGPVNHDLCGYENNTFWVMDGATPLSPSYTPSADAELRGLMDRLEQVIRSKSKEVSLSLNEILISAAQEIERDLGDMKGRKRWELPSCAVAVVRIHEKHIEYLVLGDVVIVLRSNEVLKVITDHSVKHLDEIAVKEKLHWQLTQGISSSDARKAILPLLRENRALMNEPGGYWIFNGSVAAVEHALSGVLPVENDTQLLLATDGFSRLVDTFPAYPSWASLLEALQTSSLERIANMLREIEESDRECLKYPRFSTFDDATAIYMELKP
ncbi:MAG: PP2C family serine/threonine-protein phosphatase [Moorellaceae bacterium]